MELEQAIKILKDWVETDRKIRKLANMYQNDYDKFCEKRNIAIETVLRRVVEK